MTDEMVSTGALVTEDEFPHFLTHTAVVIIFLVLLLKFVVVRNVVVFGIIKCGETFTCSCLRVKHA